jgi:hypothetical protein
MSARLPERIWPACLSALQLDRWMMGELSEPQSDVIDAHVGGCRRCGEVVDRLRAERDGTRLPPLRLVPSTDAGGPAGADRPRRASWRLPAAAAAAGLAAAASLLLLLRPAERTERAKGPGFALGTYVQHGSEVRRAGPGEVVAPGDALRFAVTTPAGGYVAVLSLDPKGRGSVYYPLGARAAPVSAGAEVLLPLGTRLDGTLGEERIMALFCTSAVELEPVRAGLEGGNEHVPVGCQVARWSFVKR